MWFCVPSVSAGSRTQSAVLFWLQPHLRAYLHVCARRRAVQQVLVIDLCNRVYVGRLDFGHLSLRSTTHHDPLSLCVCIVCVHAHECARMLHALLIIVCLFRLRNSRLVEILTFQSHIFSGDHSDEDQSVTVTKKKKTICIGSRFGHGVTRENQNHGEIRLIKTLQMLPNRLQIWWNNNHVICCWYFPSIRWLHAFGGVELSGQLVITQCCFCKMVVDMALIADIGDCSDNVGVWTVHGTNE